MQQKSYKIMPTTYFKWIINVGVFLYCTFRILEYSTYYDYYGASFSLNDYQNLDKLVLIIYMVSIGFYFFLRKKDFITLKHFKENEVYSPLEYEIVSSTDNLTMKRMFVRRVTDFFWHELDYNYTIEKNCPIGDAITFMNNNDTAGKLIETIKHKKLYASNNVSSSVSTMEHYTICFLIVIVLFCVAIIYYVTEKKYGSKPQKNTYQIEYYNN